MSRILELPEQKILNALTAKGLAGDIAISDDESLPAFTAQLIQFRANDLSADERALAILVSGQNNQINSAEVDDKNFIIILAGTADPGDLVNIRMIAEVFQEVLTDEDEWGNDIIGFVNNGIAGPFYEKDGRPIYEIGGRVIMNKICRVAPPPPEPTFGLGIWGPLGLYG